MVQINDKNATEYIARFLEGETTCEEEQALYRFFASNHIPRHLKQYKPMFEWYANGMKTSPEKIAAEKNHFRVKEICAFWSGVAAVLIMVTGIIFYLSQPLKIPTEKYCIYEGSYIEHNGRKIDDLRIILPRIQQIEAESEMICQQMNEFDSNSYTSLHSEAMQLLQEIDNPTSTILDPQNTIIQ